MSLLDSFLNTTEASGAGFDLVNPGNPLEWSKLAQAIAGSLFGMLALGITRFLDAVLNAPVTIVTGVTDWIGTASETLNIPRGSGWLSIQLEPTGLIGTIVTGIQGIIDAGWQPLTGFGWLAYPVGVAGTVASIYVVVLSVTYVREEVF